MKNIYYLLLAIFSAICCVACNDEWKDEQYTQTASFKAVPNTLGVTAAHVRYKPQGKVTYNLPVIISGSTMNSQNRTIHIGLDSDTLAVLNEEGYGHREELYFKQLDNKYYKMPDAVDVQAGECSVMVPIEFTLGDLDQSDKWVLPLQIINDPSYNYLANPHKYYRRAMLHVEPFNDYSGTYDGSFYKMYIAPDTQTALTTSQIKTYVVNENTVFLYAGLRNIDYLDRKQYKIFIEFTDEKIDVQKKKLRIYTDDTNEIKLEVQGQPYYTIDEDRDPTKVYMRRIYITMGLDYTFEDYTTIPGTPIKHTVTGTLSMQRKLNTLIPDEDQQIQWE